MKLWANAGRRRLRNTKFTDDDRCSSKYCFRKKAYGKESEFYWNPCRQGKQKEGIGLLGDRKGGTLLSEQE